MSLNFKSLLSIILFLPIAGVFLLLFSSYKSHILKIISLATSSITFLLSLILWVFFDKSTGEFQFVTKILWVPSLNINLTLPAASI